MFVPTPPRAAARQPAPIATPVGAPIVAPIKVLVIDDSALMRAMLTDILNTDPGITVVGTAPHPLIARTMIKALNPDVLTLDIEMPRMDGLSFLEKLMNLRPMPVVMVSSLTQQGAENSLRALEIGAVEIIAKPTLGLLDGMHDLRGELIDKIKAAALARPRRPAAPLPRAPVAGYGGWHSSEKIVAIGASTGGVEALREVLCRLPADAPATLVTQHMPALFTASFAQRLDKLAAVRVVEAADGVRVLPGHVYIAPGDYHLELDRSGGDYRCVVTSGPLISGHRPSVDRLFHSVARAAGRNAVGVILTGMGRDGVDGLIAMRDAGAATIGEHESSCVVYGMPKAAFEAGATEIELPLHEIPAAILKRCRDAGQTTRI